jgi:hypothetical protein
MQTSITVKAAPLNYYTKSNAISRKGEKEKKQTKTNMKKETQWSCLYETNKFMDRNLTWEKGRRWFLFLFFCSLLRLSSHFKNFGRYRRGVCIRRGVVRSMAVSFCSCLFVSNRIAFDNNNNVTQTVPMVPPHCFCFPPNRHPRQLLLPLLLLVCWEGVCLTFNDWRSLICICLAACS